MKLLQPDEKIVANYINSCKRTMEEQRNKDGVKKPSNKTPTLLKPAGFAPSTDIEDRDCITEEKDEEMMFSLRDSHRDIKKKQT